MLDTLTENYTANKFSNYSTVKANTKVKDLKGVISTDPQMEAVFNIIEKVADTNSTVLLLGESGTGKEVIARAIHHISGCSGHFVPVNCGAIPDNLLESELFGYEKGAFTGAVNSKPGRFALAEGGTIFLDEIGEMSPHLQVKLLRVLQDKVVEPVGGIKAKTINVRVIAATNVNLAEQVKQGKFREDLFYRLQVVPVVLPPLRERKNDISILVNYFSKKFSELNSRRPLVFSEEVMEVFQRYQWPGNIRELENFVERLSILVDSDAVYLSDLPTYMSQQNSAQSNIKLTTEVSDQGVDFNSIIEEFENNLILQALEKTKGNKKAAAKLLNLNRTTLVEKIKKKGLESADNSLVDE
ncbi:MAG: sigma-54-dependent Fis family transcriptional regulator [Proteobacteria bacterium]|nr:sigma-54-dependent Fis family transcriptional regulator [Pseudomonadota bacterium]